MAGGNGTGQGDRLDGAAYRALAGELGRLNGQGSFTVAGFAGERATVFEISRDEHGTPAPMKWAYLGDDETIRVEEHDDKDVDCWLSAMADPVQFHRVVAPRFIVRAERPLPGALRALLGRHELPVYTCQASLEELVRAVVRDSPLMLGYELAVLKRVPSGYTGAGRLVLTGQHLFGPGETQGAQVQVQVKVEPTDDNGIVFAVVTREHRPDLPWQARRMRPLQAETAVVPPGSYNLTATLTRPGHVRLQGLPCRLVRSARPWDDFVDLVPAELAAQPAVHLVCLIERCGGDDLLCQRIDWLEELIDKAQDAVRPLRVSVVAYGAHSVTWHATDKTPDASAWAVAPSAAVTALRGLVGSPVDEREYRRAAQLECALKLVRGRLAATGGRPVIVTAGGRPPHPPRRDTRWQRIPCPDWVNWAGEFEALSRMPGITFGALRDPGSWGDAWELLGQHASAKIDDAVDMESFVVDLGLQAVAQAVPFPVIE